MRQMSLSHSFSPESALMFECHFEVEGIDIAISRA